MLSILNSVRSIEEDRDSSFVTRIDILSGLYQKALAIKSKFHDLRLIRPDEVDEDDGISSEDREKILSEINTVIAGSRIKIQPETFHYTPEKKGAFLPVLINVSCLLVIILGALLLSLYFNRKEESIVSGSDVILSAEGRVIEALRKESEQRLIEKDNQISDIRNQLEKINQEQEKLKLKAEDDLREREKQLKNELAAVLTEEREKLKDQGLSDEDIQQKLLDLEQQKQAEYDAQLEGMKKEAEALLAENENTINALTVQYEQSLEQAQSERTRLKEELTRQTAELQALSKAAGEEVESERLKIQEELKVIQEQMQQEQLILDQITSSYEKTQGFLQESQFDGALSNLDSLTGFLNQKNIAMLPAVQRRRSVDLFIIQSLKELIEREKAGGEQDAGTLIDSANMLVRISDTVQKADSALQGGNTSAAMKLYLDALSEIPSVKYSYMKLQEIENLSGKAEAQELLGIIGEGDSRYMAGNYSAALESYGKALTHLDVNARSAELMLEKISDAGHRIASATEKAEIEKARETIGELQEKLDGYNDMESLLGELETLRNQQSELETLRSQLSELEALRGRQSELETLKKQLETFEELQSQLEAAKELQNRTAAVLEARKEMGRRLEKIKEEYEASLASYAVSPDSSREILLDLIETKLQLKRVVGSASVRLEYPDLYEDMDDYFDALSEEQRRAGYGETLQDLNAVLSAVLSADGEEELGDVWKRHDDVPQENLMADFLNSIRSILE
jgi:chromosome segregation ATPase